MLEDREEWFKAINQMVCVTINRTTYQVINVFEICDLHIDTWQQMTY